MYYFLLFLAGQRKCSWERACWVSFCTTFQCENCQLKSHCWISITGSTTSCRKNTECLNKYHADCVSIDRWGYLGKKKKMGSMTFSKTPPPMMSIENDRHNTDAVFQLSENRSFAFGMSLIGLIIMFTKISTIKNRNESSLKYKQLSSPNVVEIWLFLPSEAL